MGVGAMIPTGLLKQCPRCGKVGVVFNRGDFGVSVIWPAHEGNDEYGSTSTSRDDCALEELLRPTFGCGYDTPRIQRVAR